MNAPEVQDNITKIYEAIRWLELNGDSQAINPITIKLDELAILSFYFAEQVSEAYAQKTLSKKAYESAVARSVAESSSSAAKAERVAEVTYEALEKESIEFENLYMKTRLLLDRIDTVLDHFKQRTSFLKEEQKRGNTGNGGI